MPAGNGIIFRELLTAHPVCKIMMVTVSGKLNELLTKLFTYSTEFFLIHIKLDSKLLHRRSARAKHHWVRKCSNPTTRDGTFVLGYYVTVRLSRTQHHRTTNANSKLWAAARVFCIRKTKRNFEDNKIQRHFIYSL